ncbi:hypothetical protein ILUMI_16290 [Ignelater luminosus]|uniref:Reverse transcriptase domain-containing protein n=1 Tax=Ignelater luminosus TaxID=2038154 RepID=A0A8K0CM23_IGNLU|nr:hypothetical protein ILUMI_16290 [Ignelater luminosus]
MCENYRLIALMDIVYKIMAVAIKNKLNEIVKKEMGQYHCGFRKYRSIIDQIFTLKQAGNNSVEQNLTLFVIFIDFKQADDTVIWQKVTEAMSDLEINGKFIKMVKMTLIDTDITSKKISHYTTRRKLYSAAGCGWSSESEVSSQTWILNQKEKEALGIFERKILRRIYGGKEEGGVWKRRTNREVMELHEEPSITNIARVQRMRWLGKVGRMEIGRPTILSNIYGKRKRWRS